MTCTEPAGCYACVFHLEQEAQRGLPQCCAHRRHTKAPHVGHGHVGDATGSHTHGAYWTDVGHPGLGSAAWHGQGSSDLEGWQDIQDGSMR